MGDPAGIGSEICIKVLSKKDIYEKCKPLIIGDAHCIQDALQFTGINGLKVNSINEPNEGKYVFGIIDVLDLHNVDMDELEYGKVSAMCGKASGEYISKVIELGFSASLIKI